MRRRSFFYVLVPFLATALFGQEQPFSGTWKLNASKSKSTGPSWKSRTLTLSTDGDIRKFQSDGVNQDGMQLKGGYDAKFDGKDHPMTGNVAGGDTIALKQASPREVTFTIKKAGKPVATGRSVVSSDGKTMTISTKGTTADGKAYTSTAVYDKS